MRGTRQDDRSLHGYGGIIPADAGNTCRVVCQRLPKGDHPRGCGEHPDTEHQGVLQIGSSPRMRGTHAQLVQAFAAHGIIPADAGNTE